MRKKILDRLKMNISYEATTVYNIKNTHDDVTVIENVQSLMEIRKTTPTPYPFKKPPPHINPPYSFLENIFVNILHRII